jgi:DNA helicase IV
MVDRLWPALDPVRVVMSLLSDSDAMRRAGDGVLSAQEQESLVWPVPPRGPRSARWSLADAVLVDEAADLVERQPSLGHVVLDEAQDLSPMQLRAVGRRCSTGAATVLGDIAQGTTAWATTDWRSTLAHLGKLDASVEVLDRGYRVPAEVIDFASRLLPAIAPGVAPPRSVRENPGLLEVRQVGRIEEGVLESIRGVLRREGSIGVISADRRVKSLSRRLNAEGVGHGVLGADEAIGRLTLVPATLAKGLEFDSVIVVEPRAIVHAESRGLRRLYVALTRAVSRLVIVHAEELPEELAA